MKEYKIARHYRDIPVSSIFAGSNEIMKVIIAKQLGFKLERGKDAKYVQIRK